MIVLDIISVFVLAISIVFFGIGMKVLNDDKSKYTCAAFTLGYILTFISYINK